MAEASRRSGPSWAREARSARLQGRSKPRRRGRFSDVFEIGVCQCSRSRRGRRPAARVAALEGCPRGHDRRTAWCSKSPLKWSARGLPARLPAAHRQRRDHRADRRAASRGAGQTRHDVALGGGGGPERGGRAAGSAKTGEGTPQPREGLTPWLSGLLLRATSPKVFPNADRRTADRSRSRSVHAHPRRSGLPRSRSPEEHLVPSRHGDGAGEARTALLGRHAPEPLEKKSVPVVVARPFPAEPTGVKTRLSVHGVDRNARVVGHRQEPGSPRVIARLQDRVLHEAGAGLVGRLGDPQLLRSRDPKRHPLDELAHLRELSRVLAGQEQVDGPHRRMIRYAASLWRGVAQPGSALASGARGREFKSPRPDQLPWVGLPVFRFSS